MLRFFNQVFGNMSENASVSWSAINGLPWPELVAVLSAATMTLGNLVAIQQSNVKRMLAYSSIAHAGYMMMALPMMSNSSIEGIMMYLTMYLFMNLGAFFIVILVKNKTGGETFDDYKGLGWEMPTVGICMTCLGRVTEGKAVMDDPGVLSDEELDEGFILTCISKPDSEEITIDFDDV